MASGMRDMKMSLIYEIRKRPVAEKRPDGAVEIDSSSFFAVPLPPFAGFLQIFGSSLVLCGGVC
jgi:hypothetical protein